MFLFTRYSLNIIQLETLTTRSKWPLHLNKLPIDNDNASRINISCKRIFIKLFSFDIFFSLLKFRHVKNHVLNFSFWPFNHFLKKKTSWYSCIRPFSITCQAELEMSPLHKTCKSLCLKFLSSNCFYTGSKSPLLSRSGSGFSRIYVI